MYDKHAVEDKQVPLTLPNKQESKDTNQEIKPPTFNAIQHHLNFTFYPDTATSPDQYLHVSDSGLCDSKRKGS